MLDLSLVRSVFDTLGIEPPARLTLLEAGSLRMAHVLPAPIDMPILLTGIDSSELVGTLQIILLAVLPGDTLVFLVQGSEVRTTAVSGLSESGEWDSRTCLYIPAQPEGASFEAFVEIVAHLRAPDGCPWDREQTHATLRQHLLEEAYETLSAMDAGDPSSMREEFGDLLLQIVLNSQIAYEAGTFNIRDVVKNIHDKIIHRHPHVFGEVKVDGVGHVLQNWEKLKEKERRTNGEEKGFLDGVPAALPALTQAQEYQDRAARVGFDWPEIEGVLEKIVEEIREVEQAGDPERVTEELGDLFFALVNLARWKNVDAESALRATNFKFRKRFAYIEMGAKGQGRNLSDLSLDEMENLWQEAKRK